MAPALDTLSGARVSVLQAPVSPAEAGEAVTRLQRWSRVRHAHLAEVRAVEHDDDRLVVVCELLHGRPALDVRAPLAVTVRSVHRLSTQLLGAVAALHQGGIVHGGVSGASVLLARESGVRADVTVTLLPVPVGDGERRDDESARPGRSGASSGADSDAAPSRDGDVAGAAAVLLALLRRAPVAGLEESVLAEALTRRLRRSVGEGDPHARDV